MASPGGQRVFEESFWIWYGTPCMDLVNSFMQARRTFHLKEVPKTAPIHITADAAYRLFVNGQPVCRGPARGFQVSWPYDSVDISPCLRTGENCVAVLAHNPGISNFQYVHQGWAGLLVDGCAGEVSLNSGSDWKVRRAAAYKPVLARLSAQQGFQEHFDARLDDGGWVDCAFNDEEWSPPVCSPSYRLPWPSLEPRGIPLLSESEGPPARVLSKARSERDVVVMDDNVVIQFSVESHEWSPCGNAYDGTAGLEVRQPGVWCLDFEREVVGTVVVEALGAAGGETIDLIAAEIATGGVPYVPPPNRNADGVSIGGRIILREGTTRHGFFQPWGMRYLVVACRHISRPLSLRVSMLRTGYPLDADGAFECSDATLNRIHRASVVALECCMLDVHVDCPMREQALWSMDAFWQSHAAFSLAGEDLLHGRCLALLGQQTTDEGVPLAVAPGVAFNHAIPDYAFYWLMGFEEHFRRTGSLQPFEQRRAGIDRVLGFFDHRTDSGVGLLPLPQDKCFWTYLSLTPSGLQPGQRWFPTLYNLLYCGALKAVAELLREIGESESADLLKQRKISVENALLGHCLDPKNNTFWCGVDEKGQPFTQVYTLRKDKDPPFEHDPISSAWAVLLDVCPGGMDRMIAPVREAMNRQTPSVKIWIACALWKALQKAGHTGLAVQCVKRWWHDELMSRALTATPEFWGKERDDYGGSCCHAWGAHPIVLLNDEVLGLKFMERKDDGTFVFRLQPGTAFCESAEGFVGTPTGKLQLQWKFRDGTIHGKLIIPPQTQIVCDLPGWKELLLGEKELDFKLGCSCAA